jgi:hypothetical protein
MGEILNANRLLIGKAAVRSPLGTKDGGAD